MEFFIPVSGRLRSHSLADIPGCYRLLHRNKTTNSKDEHLINTHE